MEFLQLSSSVLLLFACICCVPVSCGESSTSTPPPHQACSSITGSCEECLKNVSCLWCYTTNACLDYPVRNILPPSKLCRLSDARWGVCWVNFEALIIAMAVVGGILLISITICCCCCCCRKRSSGPDRDEERMARRREERMQRSDERKSERKTKHDEIRKKYGLLSKSDHPYSRFEND